MNRFQSAMIYFLHKRCPEDILLDAAYILRIVNNDPHSILQETDLVSGLHIKFEGLLNARQNIPDGVMLITQGDITLANAKMSPVEAGGAFNAPYWDVKVEWYELHFGEWVREIFTARFALEDALEAKTKAEREQRFAPYDQIKQKRPVVIKDGQLVDFPEKLKRD